MYKLGRRPPDYRKPRLWLEDYAIGALPTPVYPLDRAVGTSWPMYLNDTLGDCTIAGLGHMVGAWSKIIHGTAGEVLFTNDVIEAVYSAVGGYVPGDPNTDNGCVMSDVLAYWQSTGVSGHKISAYAQLSDTSEASLNWALKNFGSVYLGINCPQSAQQQFGNAPWTYVKGSPIAGGHCITLQSNASAGVYGFTTWGALQAVEAELPHALPGRGLGGIVPRLAQGKRRHGDRAGRGSAHRRHDDTGGMR